MKDIFIDNNIAKNFAGVKDKEYIKLIFWLLQYSNEEIDKYFSKISKDVRKKIYSSVPDEKHYLAVSHKLIGEFIRSNRDAKSLTAIPNIIDKMQREGRLNKIENSRIKEFIEKQNKQFEKLRCNSEDKEHIPVVLLSDRKIALTKDENLRFDLLHFTGYKSKITVAASQEELKYE